VTAHHARNLPPATLAAALVASAGLQSADTAPTPAWLAAWLRALAAAAAGENGGNGTFLPAGAFTARELAETAAAVPELLLSVAAAAVAIESDKGGGAKGGGSGSGSGELRDACGRWLAAWCDACLRPPAGPGTVSSDSKGRVGDAAAPPVPSVMEEGEEEGLFELGAAAAGGALLLSPAAAAVASVARGAWGTSTLQRMSAPELSASVGAVAALVDPRGPLHGGGGRGGGPRQQARLLPDSSALAAAVPWRWLAAAAERAAELRAELLLGPPGSLASAPSGGRALGLLAALGAVLRALPSSQADDEDKEARDRVVLALSRIVGSLSLDNDDPGLLAASASAVAASLGRPLAAESAPAWFARHEEAAYAARARLGPAGADAVARAYAAAGYVPRRRLFGAVAAAGAKEG
jgi:hypothetical protein